MCCSGTLCDVMLYYVMLYIILLRSPPPSAAAPRSPAALAPEIHPVRNPRFGSFRTQPLESFCADSERTSLKRNPTLGANLG